MQKNKSKKSPAKKKSPAPKVPDSKSRGAVPKRAAAASKKSAPKGTAKPGARPDPKPVASKSSAARTTATPTGVPEKSPKRARKQGGTPEVESPKPLADEAPRPASSEAPRPIAPDRQPKPERTSAAVLDDDDRTDCIEIPGDAIDGTRLSHAIRYAARVTPRKGGHVVFSAANDGQPLVSGHDLRRSHTGFLSLGAACHLEAAVPRAEAIELADAIDGLAGPRVRIAADGLVLIRHGVGQPAMRFRIGSRAITFAWAPPSQSGRAQADGSLRIQASWQQEACKWSKAIVHTFQSKDGIEFNTLTDAESGELLGRAVLAEDGRDLYAEDNRQTEIPGSRTAGRDHESPFERAVRESEERATENEHRERAAAAVAPAPEPVAEADDAAPVVLVDGKPLAPPAAEPVEETGDGRVWVAQIAWDDLSPEGLRAISDLVEPGTLTSDGTPGWVGADVAGASRRALEKTAAEHDLTLHWGAEPPRTNADAVPPADVLYWVAEDDWDDLEPGDYDALTALVGDEALDGRPGWISARVPAAKVAEFVALANAAKLTLHRGEEPPASGGAGEATG